MRLLDQLLLAASVLPLAAMVLLLLAAFRVPREQPVRARRGPRRDA